MLKILNVFNEFSYLNKCLIFLVVILSIQNTTLTYF